MTDGGRRTAAFLRFVHETSNMSHVAILTFTIVVGLVAAFVGGPSSVVGGPSSAVRPSLIRITGGLESPVDVVAAGDVFYVLEQTGRVRVVRDGVLIEEPFLDIVDRVGSRGNEQGLLGIAFAPDFAQSRRFFVNYTDRSGDTVVAGFRALDERRADPRSEWRVLFVDQPYVNHNGGGLRFGPDGMLYIGMGDGGSGGDPQNFAQNTRSLLGKMLRIDVSKSTPEKPYAIPKDNPNFGVGARREIWAVGLRNPWRFSFDRRTGDLWSADVGQNEYEEVNRQPAGRGGLNYGWKMREGLHDFEGGARAASFTEPVHDYAHGDDGCSVTGGFVYRGREIPTLVGAYVFGDFCSGRIWALRSSGTAWRRELLLDTEMQITSFGEDADGELYALDRSGMLVRLAK